MPGEHGGQRGRVPQQRLQARVAQLGEGRVGGREDGDGRGVVEDVGVVPEDDAEGGGEGGEAGVGGQEGGDRERTWAQAEGG